MITTILANQSLKIKMVIIVSLPLLLAIGFGIMKISNSYSKFNGYSQFYDSVRLSNLAETLIHEMQKERGMSAGYVGSKGKNPKDPLLTQRRNVDKQIEQILQMIKEVEDDTNKNVSLISSGVESALKNIGQARQNVDQLSFNVGQVLSTYTSIIEQLLEYGRYNLSNAPSVGLAQMTGSLLNVTLSKEKAGLERGLMSGVFSQDKFTGNQKQRFIELKAQVVSYWDFVKLYAEDEALEAIKEVDADPRFDTYLKMVDVATLKDSGFGIKGPEWFAAATAVIDLKRKIEQSQSKVVLEKVRRDRDKQSSSFYTFLTFIILVLAVSLGLITIIANMVTKTMTELENVVDSMKSGDLLQVYNNDSKDEFGRISQIIEQFRQHLLDTIGQVNASAKEVSQSAPEIADASMSLSSSVAEQAANLENSASALEELSAAVQGNAENARETKTIATAAAEIAEQSSKAVLETVEAMKKITEKVTLIEDVAYQTNILALNAAIEAARAGEFGKGFTVVADKVGELAASTSSSTAEIQELAKNSVQVAEHSGSLLAKMVPEISKTSKLVEEISNASSEQAIGINEIKDSVMQLDSATQSNAAMSEELAATSANLTQISQELDAQLAHFSLSVVKEPKSVNKTYQPSKSVIDESLQWDESSFKEY